MQERKREREKSNFDLQKQVSTVFPSTNLEDDLSFQNKEKKSKQNLQNFDALFYLSGHAELLCPYNQQEGFRLYSIQNSISY